jgi:hypothetical protein
MSFMTERKAKEVFSQYMQAEAIGNDTLAIQLEKDLNNAGWYIKSGQDGLTIEKKQLDIPDIDLTFAPKESAIAPTPSTDNPNGKLWKNIGIAVLITVGIVALILISIKVVKVIKNKQHAANG